MFLDTMIGLITDLTQQGGATYNPDLEEPDSYSQHSASVANPDQDFDSDSDSDSDCHGSSLDPYSLVLTMRVRRNESQTDCVGTPE